MPCVPWLFLFAEVVETCNCVVTVEEGNSVAAAGADVVNTVVGVVVVVVVVIVADVVVVLVVTGVDVVFFYSGVVGVASGVVVIVEILESWLQHLHDAYKYVLAVQGIDTAWP